MCATSWMLTHLACITHRRMPRGAARRRSQCIGVTQHADLCAARLANTCTHVQDDARSHHVKYGPGVGCASLWDGARCGLEVWPSLIAPARAAARCVLVSCGDAAHPTPQFCRSGSAGDGGAHTAHGETVAPTPLSGRLRRAALGDCLTGSARETERATLPLDAGP